LEVRSEQWHLRISRMRDSRWQNPICAHCSLLVTLNFVCLLHLLQAAAWLRMRCSMHRSDLIRYRTDKVLVHVNLNTHISNAAGSSLVADALRPSPSAAGGDAGGVPGADGGAADISFSAAEKADKLDPPPAGFSPARQPGVGCGY